jgi:hypothetical protein
MRRLKPSPFFHQQVLDVPTRRRLGHAQRRVLAWIVGCAIIAGAAWGAIHLAHPERFQQTKRQATQPGEEVVTTTTERGPGVLEVEVQRGKETRTYRFRRVKDKTAIEEVTPQEEEKRSWWERWWGE